MVACTGCVAEAAGRRVGAGGRDVRRGAAGRPRRCSSAPPSRRRSIADQRRLLTSAGVSMVGYLNNRTDESLRTELSAVPLAAGACRTSTPRQRRSPSGSTPAAFPSSSGSQWPITIIARPDFKDHIQVLAQAPATLTNGLWVPDDPASVWKVKPGDALRTLLYQTTAVLVQGIRSMASGHLRPAWCSVKPLVQTPELSMACRRCCWATSNRHDGRSAWARLRRCRSSPGWSTRRRHPELADSMAAGLHAAEPAIHAADTGDVGGQPMTITTPLRRFLDRAGLVGRTLRRRSTRSPPPVWWSGCSFSAPLPCCGPGAASTNWPSSRSADRRRSPWASRPCWKRFRH